MQNADFMTPAAIVGRLMSGLFEVVVGRMCLVALFLVVMVTVTAQATGQDAPADSASNSSAESESDMEQLPMATNLETSLPLKIVTSPLRWGRLSLLSFGTTGGYDTNPDLQVTAAPSSFVSFNGLAVYSIRHGNSNFDFQYRPFALFTGQTTIDDFSANSADLQFSHKLGRSWVFTADEQFSDSPKTQSSGEVKINLNLGGIIATVSPFLSSGRNLLLNNLGASLGKNSGGRSSWVFSANQSFIRLSSLTANGLIHPPPEEAETQGVDVTWSQRLGFRDTFHVSGEYKGMVTLNSIVGNVNYFTPGVGWGHVVTPTIHFSVEVGPGWSASSLSGIHSSGSVWRTTARGSAELAKEIRSGQVELSFSRSDNFSGVISDGFNNLYSLRIARRFGTRWSVNASGSYVQEHMTQDSSARGKMAQVGLGYHLARDWSVTAQGRYLDVKGTELFFAPERSLSLGLRWNWAPEKP